MVYFHLKYVISGRLTHILENTRFYVRYIYFGKRLRAGVELPLIICFFIYTAGAEKTFSVLAALLAHELGHLAAALFRGRRLCSVTLSAAGADITYKGIAAYKDDIVICSAGPAVNIVTALVFAFVFPAFSFAGAFYGTLRIENCRFLFQIQK